MFIRDERGDRGDDLSGFRDIEWGLFPDIPQAQIVESLLNLGRVRIVEPVAPQPAGYS